VRRGEVSSNDHKPSAYSLKGDLPGYTTKANRYSLLSDLCGVIIYFRFDFNKKKYNISRSVVLLIYVYKKLEIESVRVLLNGTYS